MATAPVNPLTPEEYLAAERASNERKCEFLDGHAWMMAGVSRQHVRIAANLTRHLGNAFDGSPCEVFATELRLKPAYRHAYFYPDLMIVCGEAKFTDDKFDTLTNPNVIIEILSESTESFDRGRKFEIYRTIPELQEYILIAQDRIYCERFRRGPADTWVLSVLNESNTDFEIESIDVRFPLPYVYERVEFPAPPADSPDHEEKA